jgi:hypothetical protein
VTWLQNVGAHLEKCGQALLRICCTPGRSRRQAAPHAQGNRSLRAGRRAAGRGRGRAPRPRGHPHVDDCLEAQYLDRTFDWDFAFAGSAERCIKVRVGQTVRWVSNFGAHPLEPDEGDRPNPIVANTGDSGVITFTRAGIFGDRCNFHFEMRGAIQVVDASAVPWGDVKTALGLGVVLLAISAAFSRPGPVAYKPGAPG